MLTAKQEKFIQNIVKGMSQRDAYKDAYDTTSMSEGAIDVEASRLLQNPKVALRQKELIDAIAKPTIMTAQERMEYCTKVLLGEITEKATVVVDGETVEVDIQANLTTKSKFLDILNKMSGEYTTKIEGSVSVKLEDLL